MRIPQIFIKVADWFNNESVTNNWLTAVGEGVSTYVNSPAVSAYQQIRQSIATSSIDSPVAPVVFDTIEFDLDPRGSYDKTTGIFQPHVAGYYLINATVGLPNVTSVHIFKNGASYRKYGPIQTSTSVVTYALTLSQSVYLNGTTDYVTIGTSHSNASATLTDSTYTYSGLPMGATTFFSANLIRPA